MKTVFLQALDVEEKVGPLKAAIAKLDDRRRYEIDPNSFAVIPGAPFSYWVSDGVRSLFRTLPPFQSETRTARIGASTKNNFRFLRLSWEVPTSSRGEGNRWRSFAKGGRWSPFYADLPLVINWAADAREIEAELLAKFPYLGSNAEFVLHRSNPYFAPGATWTLRAARFCPQCLPAGCVFSDRGYAAFAPTDQLPTCVAIFNSRIFDYIFKTALGRYGFPEFIVGILQKLPWPTIPPDEALALTCLTRRAWSLKRSVDTPVEASHAFVLPALLQVEGQSVAARANAWANRMRAVEAELEEIHAEVDRRCFDLYEIDEADRLAISEGFGSQRGPADVEAETEDIDDEDPAVDVDVARLAAGLLSWTAGVAFGRFDVRLASGEKEMAPEPEPLGPLPICSPGTLVTEDGLPVSGSPADYPLAFPRDGILVDDPGDARDLTAAVRAVFDVVFGPSADALCDEVAALLDSQGQDLRAWLRSGLFEWHLKQHSMSRRKAPILWQLGTPSGRYSIWLYAHKLTDDSLFQLQNDVLAPKLGYEERQLTNLVQSSGGGPSAKERREIEAQRRFVEELRVLLEAVKRVAPLWRPTLDDGIVLVMAPLWRLVPHKPWQRELKKQWSELAAGKYDWAHLAMHLWPERVVPRCRDDRSLAIAHGLEDVFWVEDEDGTWQPRQDPTTGVDDLIRERTSAAVKDALEALA